MITNTNLLFKKSSTTSTKVIYYFQIISIKLEFRDLLKAEAIKNKYNKKQPTLLTHQLKIAAKELRNHPNITIKKADKTNIFVVLNKTDYHSKLQNILDDHTKFKKLNKNPTNQLKSNINKLIIANNAKTTLNNRWL